MHERAKRKRGRRLKASKRVGTMRNRLKAVADLLNSQDKTNKEVREKLEKVLLPVINPGDPARELSWVDNPGKTTEELLKKGVSRAHVFSTRRDALELLLDKIASLDLEARYTVAQSSRNPELGGRAIKGLPLKAFSFGRKTSICFQGGQELTVQKFFNARSPEERYYGILAEAIDSGDLGRLRQCHECEKFFVTDHLSKNYCNRKCQKLHDKEPARIRAKNWRIEHPPDFE